MPRCQVAAATTTSRWTPSTPGFREALRKRPVVAVEAQSKILHIKVLDDRVVQEVVLDITHHRTQPNRAPVPQGKDITAVEPYHRMPVKVVVAVPVL